LRDDFGVEIVNDIPTLCSKVDAILLESVDGRKHLEQVKPVFATGKRVFIDKPLAASLADAKEIARLGKKHGVPWWTSSSLRYSPAAAKAAEIKGLTGAITWGPSPIEATHELDLSWYGIHPVELLFSVMGPGCKRVTRTYTEGADAIIGEWSDGRIGIVRTIREGKKTYGITAFGEDEVMTSTDAGAQYSRMLGDVVQFFKDGKPPVAEAETLEIFTFMDAALRSKKAGGKPVEMQ
jgi:hypothetical protein